MKLVGEKDLKINGTMKMIFISYKECEEVYLIGKDVSGTREAIGKFLDKINKQIA